MSMPQQSQTKPRITLLYDDAGHGGIFQYHEAFVKKALEFLN
jgi:hypothetical protein